MSKREREKRKRGFRFSLRSTEIGLSVLIGARGKVYLCDESFAWVREYGVFAKLQKVGVFPTWVISSLKVIQWFGVFLEISIPKPWD